MTIPLSDGSGDLVYLGTTTKVVIPSQYLKPEAEFRAVWISALVGDVTTFSTETQYKKEILSVFSTLEHYHINVMIFHVRIYNDAFYKSKYNAWSKYYHTNPSWEALPWIIEEAHKRGIEFHAWFNPYRLSMNTDRSKLSSDSIVFRKPDWIVEYDKKLYLNPGVPGVDDYVVDSIMEVVKNYDIDAVHMDDYFYPYKVKNQEYPDNDTFRKYGGKFYSKEDWRRDNVNQLIEQLSKDIKKTKPNVKLGISPFGVWRNASTDPLKGSNTKAGVQNYDDLYADILLWVDNNWIDYVVPQIYWNQGFNLADYDTLVNWWSEAVSGKKTELYIGQAAYKVKEWKNSSELLNQIDYNRSFPQVKGSIFFSYKSLLDNPKNVTTMLMEGPYNKEYLF